VNGAFGRPDGLVLARLSPAEGTAPPAWAD